MGMTEKLSLLNELTIRFVEDYGLNLKDVKGKVQEVLQNYHITISDEYGDITNTATDYLFEKFSSGKKSIGMSDNTIDQYKIAVNTVEKYTNKKLADIETEDITTFLRLYAKDVSYVTVRAKYQLLSSVYNYLYVHRYIKYNPITSVDVPKVTVLYKTPITDCEIEKIKYACEKLPKKESLRDMAILHFFMSTGCRVSELCNVKMKDLDLDEKICTVMGKGKKQRPVVLSDRAVYRIKLYLETRKDTSDYAPLFAHIRGEEKQLTADGVEHIIKKLRIDVNNNLTCHSFRRYYATELRRRDVNIQIIANSLGHANLNQINRYSLYNKNEVIEKVRNAL